MQVLDIVNTDSSNADTRQPGKPWELNDAAEFLSVCRKTLERGIRDEKLKVIRFGRRVLIPDAEVRRVAECGL